MSEFKKYRKKKIAELRPVNGKELKYGLASNISISPVDKENGHPFLGDMIAGNPKNYDDQWLVNHDYFVENFEPLENEIGPENAEPEKETELEEAIKILRKHLNEDSEYRYSWQANIAMAFKDEFDDWVSRKVGRNKAPDHIHNIANEAAKRFLDQLSK